jgi:2-C-methyl-D-erythritol 4-phosphate cytidylyltransferase/2-C-methyl-D-erythritol 2,4-cyclodiphosphate synthase
LFPPGREELRGISSLVLLERTAAMLTERGLSIANVDVTVVLEAPRVAPLATAMRRAMARALALPDERISVKAKTNERMGFVGRGEGIAAFAVVLLNSPDED